MKIMNPAQFDSLLRVKDSQIKEREQIINSLKLQIDSLETCYKNSLQNGNYLSGPTSTPVQFDSQNLSAAGQGDTTNINNTNINTGSDRKISDSAEIILKNSEIKKLKNEISQNNQDFQKRLNSLSRQLASEEHNGRTVKHHYNSDRDNLNTQIINCQNFINNLNDEKLQLMKDKELVNSKNQKLVVRLETVNKYMELLPTREEHIQLERQKTDFQITTKQLTSDLTDEKLSLAKSRAKHKEKDDYISNLINIIENLKLQSLKNDNEINLLNNKVSENAMKLDNEERISFNRLKHENKSLKLNLEKSINLSNEVTNRLNKEKEEKDSLHTDLRCEIARERAVSETLRQAIIDMQEDKEKANNSIGNLEDNLQHKNKQIESLKLDLQDSSDTFKALDTIRSVESVLNTVSNQVSTIVNVIDRQIIQSKQAHDQENGGHGEQCQDIMDISRLLSCSVTNKGSIFKNVGVENENLLSNMGEYNSNNVLGQPREKAYETAQKQLKVAVNLQTEIDELRLRLSDRWTDHLASNCQIQ